MSYLWKFDATAHYYTHSLYIYIYIYIIACLNNIKIILKAMKQPDHMVDLVIILSVNFCPCKIKYQIKNLWGQRKCTKEGRSTLEFLSL